LGTENVLPLTTLISQGFLKELSVGPGKYWQGCDFFALGLILSQDNSLTTLSLTVVAIDEEAARNLVDEIRKINRSLI